MRFEKQIRKIVGASRYYGDAEFAHYREVDHEGHNPRKKGFVEFYLYADSGVYVDSEILLEIQEEIGADSFTVGSSEADRLTITFNNIDFASRPNFKE